jgi:hypothetical protein
VDAHQEVLVVVADDHPYREAIELWRRAGTVTQLLPPRLALLIPDPGREPPHVPGTRWFIDAVPADVLLDLAPHERIFVAGWRDRRSAKARTGDGLNWGAPGFTPPGPPPDVPAPPSTPRSGWDSDR